MIDMPTPYSAGYVRFQTNCVSSFNYFFTRSHNRGKAVVIVDDESGLPSPYAEIDLYASVEQFQSVANVTLPSNGPHTVDIVVYSQKNPLSTGYYIDLDKIVFYP